MKNKIPTFVILGAGEKATKCVSVRKIQGKNAYALDFLKLKDTANYDYGETVKVEDLEGVYASLVFMKAESVDAVIKTLERIKKAMEADNGTMRGEQTMTNNERINQMSAQEKARWILELQEDNCNGCIYYKKHEGIWICNKEIVTDSCCLKGREKWLEAEVGA